MPRRIIIAHLIVHTIAVGIAAAALTSMARAHFGFDVLVALVFFIVALFSYPAQAVMRSLWQQPPPRFWPWMAGAATTALAIFAVTHFVHGA